MANIQEEVNSQIWELLLRFLGTGTEFVYQISHEGNIAIKQGGDFVGNLLTTLINKKKENKEPTETLARMLDRFNKGEGINTMLVPEEDAIELKKRLDDKDVLCFSVDNLHDDAKLFWYMSDDVQKFADVVSVFQAEKGLLTELNPQLFLDNFAKDGVGTISGLDKTDLEVFRNFAKVNRLVFSSTPSDEPNKYIVVYDPKDTDTVKKTMASVIWALSGSKGKELRVQMGLYLKNKLELHKTLLEPEKEYYIVSTTSPDVYVHLTANELTYYKKGNKVLEVARSDSEFVERGMRAFDGMGQTVALSREEYEQFIKDNVLDKEALKKLVEEKAKGAPNLDAIKEAQKEQNERLERLESKMALDDENTAGFWIYDDSIEFASSGTYEDLEDVDEQTREDVADAKQQAKEYKFFEVENRNIDYLISQAEKHRRQQSHSQEKSEPQKEPSIDQTH